MTNPAPGWLKHPQHRVDLTPYSGQVTVTSGDELLARSSAAIKVVESHHDTVWYLPMTDVVAELEVSETSTYCPFKGYASYRHLKLSKGQITDGLWCYEAPYDECLAIKGYVSFYADKVVIEAEANG